MKKALLVFGVLVLVTVWCGATFAVEQDVAEQDAIEQDVDGAVGHGGGGGGGGGGCSAGLLSAAGLLLLSGLPLLRK
ncbi:MAG: hypothetical protein LBC93_01890 [Synergistaceae bacterium]|nr:hypothetical protein [Synergistaceae bacterium]